MLQAKKKSAMNIGRLLSLALCAAVMLVPITSFAMASSTFMSTSIPISKPVPMDCSKYPLAGDKLIELIHKIAMHGDLTDIPFIEKTLNVKFKLSYSYEKKGKHYLTPVSARYTTGSLFGSPVYATLLVQYDHELQQEYQSIADMRIGSDPNGPFAAQCLQISSATFEHSFGSKITYSPSTDGGPPAWVINVHVIGKNNSFMSVGYGPYNTGFLISEKPSKP